jgi:hypothetical protein
MSRAAKLRRGIGFCELRILLWSIGGNGFYFLVSRLQEGNKGGNIPMCTSIYIYLHLMNLARFKEAHERWYSQKTVPLRVGIRGEIYPCVNIDTAGNGCYCVLYSLRWQPLLHFTALLIFIIEARYQIDRMNLWRYDGFFATSEIADTLCKCAHI